MTDESKYLPAAAAGSQPCEDQRDGGYVALGKHIERIETVIAWERERCAKIADDARSDISMASDQDAAYEIGIRNEVAEGIAEDRPDPVRSTTGV